MRADNYYQTIFKNPDLVEALSQTGQGYISLTVKDILARSLHSFFTDFAIEVNARNLIIDGDISGT